MKLFHPTQEHLKLVISETMLSFQSDGNKIVCSLLKNNLNMHLLGMNILRFIKIQLKLLSRTSFSILLHYKYQLLPDFDPKPKQPCL